MKFISTISLSAVLGTSVVVAAAERAALVGRSIHEEAVCRLLQIRFPGTVSFPDSSTYDEELSNFWSATTRLHPTCIFVPTSSDQVGQAVSLFATTNTTFAVRGGGHMPIPGYSNTADGVLVALTKLNTLALSDDGSILSVGPGRTWDEAYTYLDPHGLIVVGGRVSGVGVPGLILGGGISYYSAQYGFASDNVVAFEIVLGSGQIVTATENQEPDLFWALKGGANNFGIVTRFDLKTHSSPTICAGFTQVSPDQGDAFFDALTNFAGLDDPKAAVVPGVLMVDAETAIYTSVLFYDDAECDQPALAEFNAIPAVNNTYGKTTLGEYVANSAPLTPPDARQQFQAFSSYVNAQASQIIHDTFLEMAPEVADVAGFQASMAVQPVPKSFIQQSIDKGGNPQAIDVTKAPYFWVIQNLSWTDAADDERVVEFSIRLRETTNERLAAVDQKSSYVYLNDAGTGQEIFQNYGPGSLERLHEVRSRYDPELVFTKLVPGGWKLPDIE